MLRERRLGFSMKEEMEGVHRFVRPYPPAQIEEGAERPFLMRLTWGTRHLSRFLAPHRGEFLRAPMSGSVTAGGLCVEAPLEGALELRYLQDATIRYTFSFEASDGQRMRFDGEKRGIRPWNLHRTHTLCYGSVMYIESGEVLSDVVVRFALSQLPRFLTSMRLG
jgi:hypothetical protein